MVLSIQSDVYAQQSDVQGIRKQRLKLNLITSYAYNVYQGQLDADSALVLSATGEHMNQELAYDEVYNDGIHTPESILIDKDYANVLLRLTGAKKIKFLLSLGGYYLYRTGSKAEDMDSAFKFLSQANVLSEKENINYWINASRTMLGRYYSKKGDYSSAAKTFSTVIQSAQRQGMQEALGQAFAEKGTYSMYGDSSKLKDLGKALKIFTERKDTVKQIEMLTRILELHFIKGELDTVESGLLRIIDLEKAMGLSVIHYDYNVLAYIAAIQGRQRDEFIYCTEALRYMESSGDYLYSDFFYIMMASLFDRLGDPTEAHIWISKSLDPSNPTRKQRIWYSSFILEIQLLARFYRPAQALDLIQKITTEFPPINPVDKVIISGVKGWSYRLLDNKKLAERYYNEAISEATKIESESRFALNIAHVYSNAAIFFLDVGDIRRGEDLLNKLHRLRLNNDLEMNAYDAEISYKIDSLRGNYISALKHFYHAKELNDSLNDVRGKTQLEEYRIKYEIDKKDKDIELKMKNIQLLTNETKLQETQARQARVVRNVMIGGTIMLLLLLALLYNRYSIKRTKNLQLEVKQEEITNKNQALTKLLGENEWLLREVHHRVKNNLQIVMSLLNSQTAYLQDEAALKAVLESQHRVQTMSLIHQKLYKSKNVSTIYMPEYISDLVAYLKDSFKTGNTIHFDVDVEAIELDVMHAVPVGLILNEVITNSIKYAFPGNADAKIKIRFSTINTHRMILNISDNGQGLPAGFEIEKSASFGMILIKGLTEDLDGTLTMFSEHGVSIEVRFDIIPRIELSTYLN